MKNNITTENSNVYIQQYFPLEFPHFPYAGNATIGEGIYSRTWTAHLSLLVKNCIRFSVFQLTPPNTITLVTEYADLGAVKWTVIGG